MASDQRVIDAWLLKTVERQAGGSRGRCHGINRMYGSSRGIVPSSGRESDGRSGEALHFRVYRRDDESAAGPQRRGGLLEESPEIVDMIQHQTCNHSVE